MLKRRSTRTDSCETPYLRRGNLHLFPISSGKVETAITNHLHDHSDHVSIRQQLQQLAGEAAITYGVVCSCEVDKYSSGLLTRDERTARFFSPSPVLIRQHKIMYLYFAS